MEDVRIKGLLEDIGALLLRDPPEKPEQWQVVCPIGDTGQAVVVSLTANKVNVRYV